MTGLAAVFRLECTLAPRRWQFFALRAGLVALVLLALAVVAFGSDVLDARASVHEQRAALAKTADAFVKAIAAVELVLVVFVAPAVLAGDFCVAKARGTLLHLLVTELTGVELFLGKLAARLVSFVLLLVAALPVLLAVTLFGGVQPEAIFAASLVIFSTGLVVIALTLLLSVWGDKPHQVLLASYALVAGWLLLEPLAWMFTRLNFGWQFNALALLFEPSSGTEPLERALIYAGVLLGVTVVLVMVGALSLRPAVLVYRQTARAPVRWRQLPAPPLDWNPIFWLAWRQPLGWSGRLLWLAYGAVFVAALVLAQPNGGQDLAMINALFVSLGLLTVSVAAATSFADERVRGGLDVLRATPLTTREILVGKWLAAMRGVVPLVVFPAVLILVHGSNIASVAGAILLPALVVSYGLWIVSLGLLAAVQFERVGWAVGVSVGIYLAVALGWVLLIMVASGTPSDLARAVAMASPFMGAGLITHSTSRYLNGEDILHFVAALGWIILNTLAALALFAWAEWVYDRDRPRR